MSYNQGSMGQVLLGFRSLLIKLSLFVLFAALLAWALGGTLFPRPEMRQLESISFGGQRWFWNVAMGGKEPGQGRVAWQLMTSAPDGSDPQPAAPQVWVDGVGPIVIEDSMYFAALASNNPNEHWRILRIDDTLSIVGEHILPDRLAVEQQLARLQSGLPVQEPETILAQRSLVLDPPADSAEIDDQTGD